MKFIQFIWLTLCQLGHQLRQLPRVMGQAGEQRKLRLAKNENEVERLDRIRNPAKYRGK